MGREIIGLLAGRSNRAGKMIRTNTSRGLPRQVEVRKMQMGDGIVLRLLA